MRGRRARSRHDPHARHLTWSASSRARATRSASSSARCASARAWRDALVPRSARRSAPRSELRDGFYVNLGIGIPTLVANYIPPGMDVMLQSENGMLGMGPFPYEDEDDRRPDQRRQADDHRAAEARRISRPPTASP